MKVEIKSSTLSIAIIVLLIGAVVTLGYQLYAPKTSITGASVAGDNGGFSSYEEMMKAHHGSGAVGAGGCSGVSVTNGAMSEYGVSYDQAGFAQLTDYNGKITLSGDQANKIVGMNVSIPCCGFGKIQASDNCMCGHHIALYGLAKLLASKGYDRSYIQAEIDKWKGVFGKSNIGGCG